PLVRRGEHHRCRVWRYLRGERQRVGLLAPPAVGAQHLVLVPAPVADTGYEQLPDAGRAERAHGERPPGPVVEVARDAYAPRVRSPYRERGPGNGAARGVVRAHVRAQDLPEVLVPALADQMQVDVAERRKPAVRIVHHERVVAITHLQPIVGRRAVDSAAE